MALCSSPIDAACQVWSHPPLWGSHQRALAAARASRGPRRPGELAGTMTCLCLPAFTFCSLQSCDVTKKKYGVAAKISENVLSSTVNFELKQDKRNGSLAMVRTTVSFWKLLYCENVEPKCSLTFSATWPCSHVLFTQRTFHPILANISVCF